MSAPEVVLVRTHAHCSDVDEEREELATAPRDTTAATTTPTRHTTTPTAAVHCNSSDNKDDDDDDEFALHIPFVSTRGSAASPRAVAGVVAASSSMTTIATAATASASRARVTDADDDADSVHTAMPDDTDKRHDAAEYAAWLTRQARRPRLRG